MFFSLERDEGDLDMSVLDFDLSRAVFDNVQILVSHLGEGLADGDVNDADRAGRQSERIFQQGYDIPWGDAGFPADAEADPLHASGWRAQRWLWLRGRGLRFFRASGGGCILGSRARIRWAAEQDKK